MSVLNLYFVVAMAIFGGAAIDVSNLIVAKNQLQVAADVAAHAAMTSRKTLDVDSAKAEAIKYAKLNMPSSQYGDVLRVENVKFGSYDTATQSFVVDDTSTEAVWVETDRLMENANPVSTFLLTFIGVNEFDVRTNAVFISADIPCLGDGFYAEGRVDMQSNNDFMNGFCVRSNTQVEFNNGNFFEHDNGVVVSMPSLDNLVIPGSGYSQNPGLEQSLHFGRHKFDVDEYLIEIVADIMDPGSDRFRDNITSAAVLTIDGSGSGNGGGNGNGNGNGQNKAMKHKSGNANGNGNGNGNGGTPDPDPDPDPTPDPDPDPTPDPDPDPTPDPDPSANACATFTPDCLTEGRIHEVTCSGGDLSVGAGTYLNVVVITDCNFSFSNGTILDGSTFITRSTDDTTIKSPQGLQIGRDDDCAAGGGAQIITFGGMRTAAKMALYGGQIIAAGDVKFAAQANGFDGASVIAGGEIDGTSNSVFGTCSGGHEDNLTAPGTPRMAG